MCSSAPKAPKPSEKDKPATLLTARDGMSPRGPTQGRNKLRIDLNNSNASAYGSSLVIPT